MTTSTKQLEWPADFIETMGRENIGDGMPSPEALAEVSRALHAVQEFLVEPILRALKRIAADVQKAPRSAGMLAEDERPVSFEDIGRLIIWTDELRHEMGYLLDPISDIALLAHEDLQQIAEGYIPDGTVLEYREPYNGRLRRFHGLDRGLGDA